MDGYDLQRNRAASEEYEPLDPSMGTDHFDKLRKWRQALILLNATREFERVSETRKVEEEKKRKLIDKMKAHTMVARVAVNFRGKKSSLKESVEMGQSEIQMKEFGINSYELAAMSKENDYSFLESCGGVKGIADKLKTNLVEGISGDGIDIENRKNVFGSNTYPMKKSTSFLKFIWESCRDSTLIILMIGAVACSAIGIKTEGVKEGWYEGGSIVLAVVIAIIFKAVKNYKQSLQINNLNKKNNNIQMEVVRGGNRTRISKFEIIVGDIVLLKTGDEVPADGLVVSCHSLMFDVSRLSEETKIIQKDRAKDPFVMAGSKVVDGHGTMLVTSVGASTHLGQLMTSKSEDDVEEESSHMERRNDVASLLIGIFGVAISTLVLIALVIRLFTRHNINPFGSLELITSWTKFGDSMNTFMKIFTVAVTILAAEVPEGLPLAATLIFAYWKKKSQGSSIKSDLVKDTIKHVNSTSPKQKRSHLYLCIP